MNKLKIIIGLTALFLCLSGSAMALPIYVGCDDTPANHPDASSANYCYVYDEAASEAGNITTIEVYCANAGGGTIDIGVFSKDGSSFTDEHYAEGLTLELGLNTYTAPTDFTALPIIIGEYIGFYANGSGTLDRDASAEHGYWYLANDDIGDDDAGTYTQSSGTYDIQIRVTVTDGGGESSGSKFMVKN